VLAGIAKRTVPGLRVHSVDIPEAVGQVLERLGGLSGPQPASAN
jgi:hypothetical protein